MLVGVSLLRYSANINFNPEAELEFGVRELGVAFSGDVEVRLFGDAVEDEGDEEENTALGGGPASTLDLSGFVDRTPLTLCSKAPLEYAVEMFGKLGLRYLCVTEEGSGKLLGVVIKKRLVAYLETLHK